MSPGDLAAAAPPGPCLSLGAVLAAVPQASRWLSLVQRAGLETVLLNDTAAQTTLLVPVDSAFGTGIDARPLRPERNMSALVDAAPDIITPLVGYSGEPDGMREILVKRDK